MPIAVTRYRAKPLPVQIKLQHVIAMCLAAVTVLMALRSLPT